MNFQLFPRSGLEQQKFDFVLHKSYSNLECGLPFMEANSSVNLVPFGKDIMELRIRANRNFIVPVNTLTPFAHASFLGPHYTLLCVLICLN